MNTAILKNLLWKEGREHLGMFVALAVIALGLHLWALDATDPEAGHYVTPMMMMIYLVVPIGSAFVAMGVAAREQSQHTVSFLRSLPLDLRWVAAVKMAVAVAAVVLVQAIAIALTIGLLSLATWLDWPTANTSVGGLDHFMHLFDMGHWGASVLLLTTIVVASLVVWIAALGVNSESEVRAGMIALVVIVALWTVFGSVYVRLDHGVSPRAEDPLFGHLAAALPGGQAFALVLTQHSASPFTLLAPFLLTHVPLAWWYIVRFGRTSERESRSQQASVAPPRRASQQAAAWLAPPRRSPLTALLWKQARLGAPVVLAGFACAAFVSIAMFFSNATQRNIHNTNQLAALVGSAIVGSYVVLGCCAGLVGGAGALTTELEPRLFTFWRSRPISLDLWFGITFVAGLAMLLLTFGVPLLLGEQVIARFNDWDYRGPPIPPWTVLPLSYASGLFTAALLRHAVYASLTGIGVLMAVVVATVSDWGGFSLPSNLVGPTILGVSLLLSLAAWQLVRRDWAILR